MSEEPSYPKEAAVGSEAAAENGKPRGAGDNKRLATGFAMGIGSAAIVAALLYAGRSKRGGKGS